MPEIKALSKPPLVFLSVLQCLFFSVLGGFAQQICIGLRLRLFNPPDMWTCFLLGSMRIYLVQSPNIPQACATTCYIWHFFRRKFDFDCLSRWEQPWKSLILEGDHARLSMVCRQYCWIPYFILDSHDNFILSFLHDTRGKHSGCRVLGHQNWPVIQQQFTVLVHNSHDLTGVSLMKRVAMLWVKIYAQLGG